MSMVKQATQKAQEENVSLSAREPSYIDLHNGKKIRIDYIFPDTQDKINQLNVQYERIKKAKSEDEDAMNKHTREHFAKCAAAILINNYFGLKLWWWAKWRLIYHFWKLNGDDYMNIVMEAKKKAQEQQYYLTMVLLMGMTTTWTTMTKKEAEEYHHEQTLAREAQSLKNSQL